MSSACISHENKLGQVVQKPINANPRLKIKKEVYFSSSKKLFSANIRQKKLNCYSKVEKVKPKFTLILVRTTGPRSAGSVLEFQQNEPQNQQKIVTRVNNKAAAISKTMELPGDK